MNRRKHDGGSLVLATQRDIFSPGYKASNSKHLNLETHFTFFIISTCFTCHHQWCTAYISVSCVNNCDFLCKSLLGENVTTHGRSCVLWGSSRLNPRSSNFFFVPAPLEFYFQKTWHLLPLLHRRLANLLASKSLTVQAPSNHF